MPRDYKRDYKELPEFSKKYNGCPAFECMEGYAKKRRIVIHRVADCFWQLVDDGLIPVGFYKGSGVAYIAWPEREIH